VSYLVVGDGNGVVDVVANGLDFGLEKLLLLSSQGKQVFLLLLKVGFLLQEVGDILLGLLLGTDLLLDLVDLGVDLGSGVVGCVARESGDHVVRRERGGKRRLKLTFPMILPHGNDLVDNLDRGIAPALAFPDLLRVAAALSNW
jgi:hypothetical protein